MKREKRNSTVSGVIGIVLCVVFIPVILINLVLIAGSVMRPDQLPGVFGLKPSVVLSGSMDPTIQVGDVILIQECDPETLQEGDVVCYMSSGKAITHRISSVTTGEDGLVRYVTQGDANNAADRLSVSADQVQGVWNGVRVAGLGNTIMFMQTPTGMVLCIICPLALFFAWDVWRRRRLDKAEQARTAQLERELAILKNQHAFDRKDAGTP